MGAKINGIGRGFRVKVGFRVKGLWGVLYMNIDHRSIGILKGQHWYALRLLWYVPS